MKPENYLIIRNKGTWVVEKMDFFETKKEVKNFKKEIVKKKVNELLNSIIWKWVVDKKLINELEEKFINTSYAPIIEFVYNRLNGQSSTELLKNYFRAIYTSKDIDDSTKKLFSDFLAKFVLPGAWEDNMHDPMKFANLIDYLKKLYPKYDWENKVKEDFPLE